MKYIYEAAEYPQFTWDSRIITNLLTLVATAQGRVLGKMQQFGFGIQQEAMLNAMTEEITKSSEIEGEILNSDQVRSSLARKLNISLEKEVEPSHHIEGVVSALMDAVTNYAKPLTRTRLFGWHAALFPTGYSGLSKIKYPAASRWVFRSPEELVSGLIPSPSCLASFSTAASSEVLTPSPRIKVAAYRSGEMQIISNKGSREIVHYEAPPPQKVPKQMTGFLRWLNTNGNENPLLKAAIAHLWFVIIHPFDDGNGRLTRVITEMLLACAENTSLRFYSMSAQIQKEKKSYYAVLEQTTNGTVDITRWLTWFLECLERAIRGSEKIIGRVLQKAVFWQKNSAEIFHPVQREIINRLFNGFTGNMTSGKTSKIFKVSLPTATRLLQNLAKRGFLEVRGAGRSTHYVLPE